MYLEPRKVTRPCYRWRPPGANRDILSCMTTSAHRVEYTYAEYLALEAASNVKHEYLDGQIYGMAGGTPQHAALAATIIGMLFSQLLGGRCRAFDSDLRVRVKQTGLATYPDVTVVCGPREHHPEDAHAVTNPTVVFEVLSPSTRNYDQGEKLDHFMKVPSLMHYVTVEPTTRRVDVWSRRTAGAAESTQAVATSGDEAALSAIGASLDVDALYDAAAEPV